MSAEETLLVVFLTFLVAFGLTAGGVAPPHGAGAVVAVLDEGVVGAVALLLAFGVLVLVLVAVLRGARALGRCGRRRSFKAGERTLPNRD